MNNTPQASPYTLPSPTLKILGASSTLYEYAQLPSTSILKSFFGHIISKVINIALVPITLIIDGLANLIFKQPIIFIIESGICYLKGIFNPTGAFDRFRNYHFQVRPLANNEKSEEIENLKKK